MLDNSSSSMAVCILVTLAVTEDLPVCFLLADTLPAINNLFKKLIQFLECSWNREYIGSLARSNIEFIFYIYILL